MSENKIAVSILGEEKEEHSLKSGARISDLLKKLGHNPEAVVTKRNEKIVPEDEELEDGDEIEIIPVVSGG